MAFPNSSSYPTPLISFAAATSTAVTTTFFSFPTVSVGSAASDRVNVVALFVQGQTASAALSSLTVGGLTATIVTQTGSVVSPGFSGFAVVANPSNSSATINLTMSTSVARCMIGVYAMTGYNGIAAIAQTNFTAINTTVVSVTGFVPANGAIIALASDASLAASPTITFGALSADYSVNIANSGVVGGGTHLNAANRSQTITATIASTASPTFNLLVASLG
jgi:hypothetical protein